MLSRQYRFHGRTVLLKLYRRSTTLRSGTLRLDYAPGRGSQPFRAAVVVSKKVSKQAVVRNRIRRRVFEIVRRHAGAHGVQADIIVTVYDVQAATMPAAQLQQDVEHLLTKLPAPEKSGK